MTAKFFRSYMENSESMYRKVLRNLHATSKIFQKFKEFYETLKASRGTLEKYLRILPKIPRILRDFTKKFQKVIQFSKEVFHFLSENRSPEI